MDNFTAKELVEYNNKVKEFKHAYTNIILNVSRALSAFKQKCKEHTPEVLYTMADYISFYKHYSKALSSLKFLTTLSEEVIIWLLQCNNPVEFIYNSLITETLWDYDKLHDIANTIDLIYHKTLYYEIVWASYDTEDCCIDCDIYDEFGSLETAMECLPPLIDKTRKRLEKDEDKISYYEVFINKMSNTDDVSYCVELVPHCDKKIRRPEDIK